MVAIKFKYTNWKGVSSVRKCRVDSMWIGQTEWHPETQPFLGGFALDKKEHRDYALMDMKEIEFIEEEEATSQEN